MSMAHLFCWPTFLVIFVAVTGFAHQSSQMQGKLHFIVAALANGGTTVASGSGGTVAPRQQSSECCRRSSVTARHSNATKCTFRQQVAQTVLDYVSLPQQLSQSANLSIVSSSSIRTRRQLRNISVAHRHPQHAKLSSKSDTTPLAGTMHFHYSVGVEQQPLRRFIHLLPSPPVPAAWWEACAAISATGLSGLQMQLHPHECTLPDVQQSSAAHCQLGRQPWAYTFADPTLSVFVSSLFLSITQGWAASAKQLGAKAPQLSRFDLFHGHIFIANDCNNTATAPQCSRKTNWNSSILQYSSSMHHSSHAAGSSSSSVLSTDQGKHNPSSSRRGRGGCRVGVLFHASEYPAYDESAFPIMLGHCQANSSCWYDQRAMDLRNILWWQGQLAILDVGEASPLHNLLLHEGTEPLRTVYEEDFGKSVADLLLLRPPHHRRRRRMTAELQRWGRLLQAEAASGHGSCSSTQHHGVFVSY